MAWADAADWAASAHPLVAGTPSVVAGIGVENRESGVNHEARNGNPQKEIRAIGENGRSMNTNSCSLHAVLLRFVMGGRRFP